MKRHIEKDLMAWKNRKNRMPLLLRGARQVGKTFVVEKFGKENFRHFLSVNFEQNPEVSQYFETLDPEKIITALEIHTNRHVVQGETLLFLDEIQECPRAVMALRYFKEKMPELHVIAAGSLLEFIINDESFRMPVGRVQYLFLKPLNFEEYLEAAGHEILLQHLRKTSLSEPLVSSAHEHALEISREYMATGGMPAVVREYLETKSFHRCQEIQSALLKTYRDDFGKYAKYNQSKYLKLLFEQTPGMIAKRFKYSKIDPHTDPRTIRTALQLLTDAGLIYPVYATAATGVPMISSINRKKFKLLFLDIGLVHRAAHLDLSLLLHEDLMLVNQGALIEQYVGQELLACFDTYEPGNLFFWVREKTGSSAEVDFVINVGPHILPIEVKSGKTGRLKSLNQFMTEKKCSLGLRISQLPLSYKDRILSLPFYLTGQLPRLVEPFLMRK